MPIEIRPCAPQSRVAVKSKGPGLAVRHEGTGLGDRKAVERGMPKSPQLHFLYGWNAEGEIRTPEGLAAHQISSLARWTELRYLSASPSSEARNTFSREVNGRTARARHLARTPSRLDQRVRLEDAAKDLPKKTNLATS